MSEKDIKSSRLRVRQVQLGLPSTYADIVAEAVALGVKIGRPSNFGFRSIGLSSPVPVNIEGSPIVDAAESLIARKSGGIAILGNGIVTKQGKRLVDRVIASSLSEERLNVDRETRRRDLSDFGINPSTGLAYGELGQPRTVELPTPHTFTPSEQMIIDDAENPFLPPGL